MAEYFLAFDLGASSGRAILGAVADGKMTLDEIHRFANGPMEKDGSLFWDIRILEQEIKAGLKKAVATGKNISGIAIDTWGVDYVLLKNDGNFARLPYHYRDSRTDKIVDEVYQLISRDELYKSTGIQEMQLNTIFQLYAHKKAHPQDLENSRILLMPDALSWMLCGSVECEYCDASTSALLDAEKREWDQSIINRLGLPPELFPEIVQPCTQAGLLKKDICAELGCDPIPVFHVGSHDTASAVASVPVTSGRNWAYISCGTWALLGTEEDAPILSPEAQKANFTNEGGLNGKIRFLTNIMGMWLIQECRRIWQEEGKDYSYADIEKMASEAAPCRFIIDPNYQKFFAPGDMPANIRDFCRNSGQGEIPDDKSVARCVIDSLVLCFKDKLRLLENLTGRKMEHLHIVGGGTKDQLLMQLSADGSGIPVVAGPVEATAIGNIAAQAMARGIITDLTEARKIIKHSFKIKEYQPQTDNSALWHDAFQRYKKFQQNN